jgi:hypothetical protein
LKKKREFKKMPERYSSVFEWAGIETSIKSKLGKAGRKQLRALLQQPSKLSFAKGKIMYYSPTTLAFETEDNTYTRLYDDGDFMVYAALAGVDGLTSMEQILSGYLSEVRQLAKKRVLCNAELAFHAESRNKEANKFLRTVLRLTNTHYLADRLGKHAAAKGIDILLGKGCELVYELPNHIDINFEFDVTSETRRGFLHPYLARAADVYSTLGRRV